MQLNSLMVAHLLDSRETTVPALRRVHQVLTETLAMAHSPVNRAPLLSVPLVLDRDERDSMASAAEVFAALAPHAHQAIFRDLDTAIRVLKVPPVVRPFVTAEIPLSVGIARADFLLGSDGWRAGEIGMCASVGDILVDDYNRQVLQATPVRQFADRHALGAAAPIEALTQAALTRCARLPIDGRPTAAIVDWEGYESEYGHEYLRLADCYRAAGMDAMVCHHRQLAYRGGRLWCGDRPVDVLHREFLLEDLPTDPSSAYPVLRAAEDGAIVLISDFRAEWFGNKLVFALLRKLAGDGALEAEQAALVARFLPATWLLDGDPHAVPAMSGSAASKRPAAELVLKPLVGSAGAGVVLGAEVAEAAFHSAIGQAVDSGTTHVMQEFVEPDPVPFAWLDEADLVVEVGQPHPAFFVVDGRFAGIATRVLRGQRITRCSTYNGAYVGGVLCPGD